MGIDPHFDLWNYFFHGGWLFMSSSGLRQFLFQHPHAQIDEGVAEEVVLLEE
jgi:hypothetical protein